MILKHPRQWFKAECLAFWSLMIGIAVGGIITWWAARPPTPWIEFEWLTAVYVPQGKDGPEIQLKGVYYIVRECRRKVIWRTEAIATDGQIALYGPKPAVPAVTEGRHEYEATLPLLAGIRPDGWRSTVIMTCPGETPETVPGPSTTVLLPDRTHRSHTDGAFDKAPP